MFLYRICPICRFWRHLRYHKHILKHIRWAKPDQSRLAFYKQLFSAGDLVFDVGANVGNRSKVFRKIGAKVVAFEPQSYCAEFLRVAFLGDKDFVLRRDALSNTEGEVEIHLGEAHTLATIDTEWIGKMEDGGRFESHKWTETETVPMTTLDKCIEKHGRPAFIKIDVEGHEFSVVSGLSQPVRMLSLEFASEGLDIIDQCVDHLDSLGPYQYRISLAESMAFDGDDWCSGPEIKARLTAAKERDPLVWGDVYARCNSLQ